jgi:hypothetical protein
VNPSIPPPPAVAITHEQAAELVGALDELGVPWTTITPTRWWADEECGYCPEPVDPGLAPIQPAIAWVGYQFHVRALYDEVAPRQRDPACLHCLRRAVRDKWEHYRHVWVEVPA